MRSLLFFGERDEERFVSFISFQPQLYGYAQTTKRVLQVFLTTLSIIEQNKGTIPATTFCHLIYYKFTR